MIAILIEYNIQRTEQIFQGYKSVIHILGAVFITKNLPNGWFSLFKINYMQKL